jgi:hypothetical protein
MTDIVERLRRPFDMTVLGPDEILSDRNDAADEIERLRAMLKGPFICGVMGEAGVDGLHRGYLVCPAYGSDLVRAYTANQQQAGEK